MTLKPCDIKPLSKFFFWFYTVLEKSWDQFCDVFNMLSCHISDCNLYIEVFCVKLYFVFLI